MLKHLMRVVVAMFVIVGLVLVITPLVFHTTPINFSPTEATDIFVGSTMIAVGTFIETRVK